MGVWVLGGPEAMWTRCIYGMRCAGGARTGLVHRLGRLWNCGVEVDEVAPLKLRLDNICANQACSHALLLTNDVHVFVEVLEREIHLWLISGLPKSCLKLYISGYSCLFACQSDSDGLYGGNGRRTCI